MPELTVTPDPESRPPSVRVRVDADEDTLITRAQVRRDGEIVRGQVADRTPRLVIDDYEMPYATEVEYSVEGESVPTDVPLIDEGWGDLGAWDGDTSDWVLPASDEPVAENLITDPFMASATAISDGVTLTPSGDGIGLGIGPDVERGTAKFSLAEDVPVSGDGVHRLTLEARARGLRQFRITMNWKSESGAGMGGVTSAPLVLDGPDWERVPDTWYPIGGAAFVDIEIGVDAWEMSQRERIDIRHPILTRGADLVDFFTGDSDDTGRWHYEWSGTRGESTSLKFDKDQTPTLHSDVDDAAITHTTDVPFNTVTVENPADVMVELIEVTEVEGGEETNVAVTIRSTGSGTTVQCHTSGTVRTNGGGTYTASVMDG